MKFKSLFLGMLGAAALVSCNNDVIDGDKPGEEGKVVEGLPIYATVNFNVKAGTYAGDNDVVASAPEQAFTDAAMYVYKFDGVSTYPEAFVYIATGATTKITMRATSGRKKVFVALNPSQGTPKLVYVTGGGNVSSALPAAQLYDVLNNTLYSTGSSWGLTATSGKTVKADGLIQGLAKGVVRGLGTAAAAEYTGTYNMLMTNWDGVTDNGGSGTAYASTCEFTLTPDIDSISSNGGSTLAQNALAINVQRAFAKVGMKITAAAGTHHIATAGYANVSYKGATTGATQEGEFQPWTATGAVGNGPIWVMGNINKSTLPFQQYSGGAVRDYYFQKTDDSIKSNFANWADRYDNTRVFPMASLTSYPQIGLTVTSVRDNMLLSGNWTNLSGAASTPTAATTYYAFSTENARKSPVLHDHGAYVVIGGRYNPRQVLTSITRASLASNPPTLTYTDNYGFNVAAGDTLYYIASDKIFISGLNNLQGYYAWQKGYESAAPADFSLFTSLTTNAINNARKNNDLLAYFEGQCWYRIFISNEAVGKSNPEYNALRRNHIYAVDIAEFKGPGIADPNKIIIPGEPIPPLDTYVTANITVMNWHIVPQSAQGDLN